MISQAVLEKNRGSSMIRQMFEQGQVLRNKYGADNVYDFSLGNPDLPVSAQLTAALIASAQEGRHGYMNNAGYPELRAMIAGREQQRSGRPVTEQGVVMTVGAAGALNIILKSLCNPGDEVMILKPYFSEYLRYCENCAATAVPVDCDPDNFLPLTSAMEQALSPKTKAIIINNPNNPAGVVYDAAFYEQLAALLSRLKQPVYVISDEPYAQIVYDRTTVPSLLRYFPNGIVAYSWSKSLSIPGERIGYVAVSEDCADYEDLCQALVFCNRSLGFVNAPAIWQQTLLKLGDYQPDLTIYQQRRDLLYSLLTGLGWDCYKPEGAFYLFPRSLEADDQAFAQAAAEEHILLVPGRGFGMPGYVRLAYCVDEAVIHRAEKAFHRLTERYRS
ncbi:pyridoxal phosphate-dependent aminotransferase [Oscillospiraceae bacterium HV4-5-C5C]|nr:pyridoxal phosphate-dependent aminotransferase [Oscillospiraceae bacterium HV4-5-C5C]